MSEEKKNVELKYEDLGHVNGGKINEKYKDFDDLKKLWLISMDESRSPSIVRNTFNIYGIIYEDHGGLTNANRYFYDEKEITREQAFNIIEEALNK